MALKIKTIADPSARDMRNFVCGANQAGKHLRNANWDERVRFDEVADIRTVQEGDLSPDGRGTLAIKRGIEVGHIFQLGRKYSEAFKATVLDDNGRAVTMTMGCYGIGITRIVAACIEQSHDAQGIIWPDNLAPFHLVIVEIDAHKSPQVSEVSEALYEAMEQAGIEVLLDDRDRKTSPGVKFADSELIGIPHRIVVSPRLLADGVLEYKARKQPEKQLIDKTAMADFLIETIDSGDR